MVASLKAELKTGWTISKTGDLMLSAGDGTFRAQVAFDPKTECWIIANHLVNFNAGPELLIAMARCEKYLSDIIEVWMIHE